MSTGSNRQIQATTYPLRKEVLWNVQEPGDSYDIRKSMIAKLPGGGAFMGDHLEVICLFQAAEIERLTDFLEIYKFKFKDFQRIQLDRHSYEVQIKELIQKIQNMDILRGENQKLKDFIKKQGIQIDQLNQNLRTKGNDQQLRMKYENTLQLNEELKTQNRILKSQLLTLQTKYKSFQTSKMIQMQETKRRLSQTLIEESSYQKKDNELAFLNFRTTVEGELKKLEAQIRKLQELNELKSKDLNLMRSDNEKLKEDYDHLRLQYDALQKNSKYGQEIDNEDINRLRQEYESKIALLSQELQHKYSIIREKEIKFEEVHRKNIEFEQEFLRHEIIIKDNEGKLKNRDEEILKLNELIMKIDREGARASGYSQDIQIQYESKIRQLSQEVETLNSRLLMEVSHEKHAKEEIERKSFESSSRTQILLKENEDLKRGILQNADLKRQIAELQSQRALFIQEIERLNQLNNTKNTELSRLKLLSTQNDALKSRINEIQRMWSTKYDSQLSRIKSEYEYKYTEISQLKGNELQSKAIMFEQDLERTKNILKTKADEAEKHRASSFQWQSKYSQLQIDQSYKIRNYETSLSTLKKQNEELYTKLRLQNDLQIKIKEFQNKYVLLQGELEQITILLRSREDENNRLKHKYAEDIDEINKKHQHANKRLSQHAQKIVQITNENEDLRKKINQIINNSNNVSKEAISEINRLTITLRTVEEEKLKNQNKLRQLTQEIEIIKQSSSSLTQDKEELRRRLIDSQNKAQSLISESTSSRNNIQIQNDSLRRQINEFKVSITSYEAQISRRVNNYEVNLKNLTRQNQELRKKLIQIQTSLMQANQKLKQKNEEFLVSQNNFRNMTIETENLKKYIKDYEIQVTNKFDGEVSRKYQNYQQNIQALSKQFDSLKRSYAELQRSYEELRRKNTDLERIYEELKRRNVDTENTLEDLRKRFIESQNRYNTLNLEYDKISFSLKNAAQDIETLKREKIKKEGMITTYESDISKKVTEYQNSIFNMTRSKEDLQRKVIENDLLLKQRYEQFNRLEVNCRTLNQELELSKRRYIELQNLFNQKMEGEVINKYKLYDQTINDLSKEGGELRRKLAETSNELNKKIVQVNNLNPILGENQNLKKRIQKYETSIAAYEAEVNRQFVSYEQRVQNITKQSENLKRKLLEGAQINRRISLQTEDKVTSLTRDLQRINSNYKILDKENGELRKRLTDLGDLGRVVAELENRLAITNQELQRTNSNLRSKCDDYNKLENQHRNIQLDLEATRKKQTEVESRLSYTLESEVPKKYNSYEQIIMELKKKNADIESKNQNLIMQMERFNASLRGKGDELTQVVTNYKNLSNQYEQFKRRAKETEAINTQNFQNIRLENDELRRRLQEYDVNLKQFGQDSDRKIVEYENKTKIMIQEIERLNQTVTTKNEELERCIRKIKEYELTFNQRTEVQMKNKVSFQNALNTLKRENQEFRRKLLQYGDINQVVVEYSNKLNLTGQEYEKASFILKQKTQQFSKLQTAYRNLSRQNEDLKRKFQELTDFNKRIIEYEQKINIIIQQNQKLQHSLRLKTDQLNNAEARLRQLTSELQQSKRHVIQLEKSITSKYQVEITRKTSSYEQNIMILSREREDLQRKRVEYESKIGNLTTEIQRLNGLVRNRTEELQRAIMETETFRQNAERKYLSNQNQRTALHANYKTVVNELEINKKNLYEYEAKIMQLGGEFDRLKAIIQQLQKNREDLYAKNLYLSEEIERLTEENKDLETQTKDVRLRLSDESSLQKRINEHLSLMVILFAEIETLRSRVTAKEREVETVRRSSLSPHMLKL